MVHSIPPSVLVATSLGLTMNAYFSVGSLALTYFAIPAFLLPEDALLMPPLDFVKKRKQNHFRTEKSPTKQANSGVGDSETLVDSGASTKNTKSSPSTTNYLLRQWFHIFAKGMHTYPPFALGAALSYLYCTIRLPGRFVDTRSLAMLAKRACYGLSTVLSIGIVVFTLTALKPINSALDKRVGEVVEKESMWSNPESSQERKEETEELIREWGRMNAYRAMLPLAASVSAVVALALPAAL